MGDERVRAGTPEVRASDAERDALVTRLGEAMAEGRLDVAEYEERVDVALAARSRGELERLTDDLPAPTPAKRDGPMQGAERLTDSVPTSSTAICVMGAAVRDGTWTVPKKFTALSVMGHAEIDLREAQFTAKHTTIQAHSLMGSVEVVVPDDVHVRVEGVGVMGAFWMDDDPADVPADVPIVTVTGISLMGAVWSSTQPREHQKPPKKRWWHRRKSVTEG
ncbi:DUF1707 and DUF2154 domain-containing protein [Spiractinospora alimapuensis]|uniref:DUF1707 SHOCT-like domain-containing protein n=1 Tax=Spiractinospora alimapuensis TaxID=2820884 RepID=UPI001F42C9BF|nr:DUF1707 domain-containing protein [Spiractinospora alimapuensis]QVQ50610.1 DUF1707 and DUF2154 domain-containing protein [Spiractinospora alimapuensis]